MEPDSAYYKVFLSIVYTVSKHVKRHLNKIYLFVSEHFRSLLHLTEEKL